MRAPGRLRRRGGRDPLPAPIPGSFRARDGCRPGSRPGTRHAEPGGQGDARAQVDPRRGRQADRYHRADGRGGRGGGPGRSRRPRSISPDLRIGAPARCQAPEHACRARSGALAEEHLGERERGPASRGESDHRLQLLPDAGHRGCGRAAVGVTGRDLQLAPGSWRWPAVYLSAVARELPEQDLSQQSRSSPAFPGNGRRPRGAAPTWSRQRVIASTTPPSASASSCPHVTNGFQWTSVKKGLRACQR